MNGIKYLSLDYFLKDRSAFFISVVKIRMAFDPMPWSSFNPARDVLRRSDNSNRPSLIKARRAGAPSPMEIYSWSWKLPNIRPKGRKNWKGPPSLEALPCKSTSTHLTITNRSNWNSWDCGGDDGVWTRSDGLVNSQASNYNTPPSRAWSYGLSIDQIKVEQNFVNKRKLWKSKRDLAINQVPVTTKPSSRKYGTYL